MIMHQHDILSGSTDLAPENIHLGEQRLEFYADFLESDKAAQLYQQLYQQLDWEQPQLHLAGRLVAIPRLQVWMGDGQLNYRYSGKNFIASAWHPEIFSLKQAIEERCGYRFNTALCNLYRDGQDSVAWHADDETELGPMPCVASFSLGATRRFKLKSKHSGNPRIDLNLPHNSLLVMLPGVQNNWLHQLPKTRKACQPRINITFRAVCA